MSICIKKFYKPKISESNEAGSYRCKLDTFLSKENDIELRFLPGSDMVLYYFNYNDSSKDDSHIIMTEDYLKETSQNFLKTLFTEEQLKNYTDFSNYKGTPNAQVVRYSYFINGYETDDSINLIFNKHGYINSMNAMYFGKYEPLKDNLTKERLDNAAKKIKEKLETVNAKNKNISDPIITMNTAGDVYLKVELTYDDQNGYSQLSNYYVKV